jgi:hypothetical protein
MCTTGTEYLYRRSAEEPLSACQFTGGGQQDAVRYSASGTYTFGIASYVGDHASNSRAAKGRPRGIYSAGSQNPPLVRWVLCFM